MALRADESIAFGMPGGDACTPSRARPVDLVHLARQTLGDRSLEQEVLGMFVQHVSGIRERLVTADDAERRMLAHALKGSAQGIGAFSLADCAGEIEDKPSSKALVGKLTALIDEVRDFIATIHR